MINIPQVKECLKNRVGFRQPDNPSINRIYSDLTISESGNYFQGVHPLVNLENLLSIAPQFNTYVHEPYVAETTYSATNRVGSGGKVYESLVDNNTGNAVTDEDFWKEIDLFSEWLTQMRDEASIKVINKALTEKKLRGELKSVFENLTLFDGVGNMANMVVKEGKFCFFEITVHQKRNIQVIIEEVYLQTTQNNPTLDIYIYSNAFEAPEEVQTVTFTKQNFRYKGTMEGISLDPGVYYIGYYEEDLLGQAIYKNNYIWGQPCAPCHPPNYDAYQKWSKFITVRPGYVASANLNEDLSLWDTSKIVYDNANNFGLNFSISVQCDLSDFICTNKAVFDNAIALQVGVDILQQIGNNVRNNSISEQTKKLALFALDNRDNFTPGLTQQLEKAIKALDFDMSGLGECLPCKEPRGVRYTSV